MRRAGVIVALGALAGMLGAALTASPALARGPQWQVLPLAPFTLPASFCGFEVAVSAPADDKFSKLLKTPDGSVIFLQTGFATTSDTNLATGKTVTENISGPGTLTIFPDGSLTEATQGVTVTFLAPADAARFGLPAVSVTAGALTISVDPNGNITSLSLHGRVLVDVCAALS
jgi:hypothetical protein